VTKLDQIDRQLDALNETRADLLRKRISELSTLGKRIADEIAVMQDELRATTGKRRSRLTIPDCGTETGYQRHNHLGEKCDECKEAHRIHANAQAARRRIAKAVEDVA